ncbi:uncharacterized protein HD556DRAFT_1443590 [Suillus plorans]|uniref:Uncharacterized protein n=1 Tax=Suillus plorans TaxID=116603 RepID=A0A9P7ARA0_9AGAM|nr:uncharacterized protein HD556DRAFT_1443590 [Suillus plorans]KAG1793478.1 hypothetical protein HD556DRAFT_1443590 [Suillus plorans]
MNSLVKSAISHHERHESLHREWDEFLQSDGAQVINEEAEEQEDEAGEDKGEDKGEGDEGEIGEEEEDEGEIGEDEDDEEEDDPNRIEADEGEELDDDFLIAEGYGAL